MSGDVQPRKRKEKRRKKEDSEEVPTSFSSDEQLHVHKDASTGGNICAKILFFLLSFVLLVMIGLVLFEYRGSADDETLVPVSKWAPTFDGWLETPVKHDEHADITESGEQEHEESGEHENESAEGEEHLSEEAASKEQDDDEEEEEAKGSEEEETKSAEEEEDEDEEADKLEDEESEEADENEIEDRDDDDDDEEEEEEEEEEEGSEEDVYEHEKSEEDMEAEKDDDSDGEEEDEEEDVEAGGEELDDEEEKETPAYQHESEEIDDLLHEIPGITESDEDEEGDNLARSDEVIDKKQKIPGVHEKKIKVVSEEEADVPRRKQEKEVSEPTQPVEGASTFTVEQKPHEQHKNEDHGQAKLKAHQSAAKQKAVTEKPVVTKHEKPETLHTRGQPASKNKPQTPSTEHPAMKNDGFPSGPGGTGQGHKSEDVVASKITPSKKQKVGGETTKDQPSEATLPKKQKDDTGPALKSEPLPTVSGGKNFKDKDVSSDGVHSPPKASRIGDKIEPSLKVGKSGIVHKATEQSSPTKLDANDRASVSKSHHVDKSTEEPKKTVESKDKPGSKPVHSPSASGVKSSKFDTKDAQKMTDDTVKISDLKTNAHGKSGTAGNSASFDEKGKAASNDKEKESLRVEPAVKKSGNLNSQTKQMKVGHSTDKNKLVEEKVENLHKNKGHPSNQENENDGQLPPKLDRHAETVNRVAAKDLNAAKVHEDPRKSKVDVKKQKVGSPASAKASGDRSSEVPVKVSTDKARKVSADNTIHRTPEKNADVNAAREKSGDDNTPPKDTHHSKSTDAKVSEIPEPSLKHSVRKGGDSSKSQEVKPNIQSDSSRKNNRDEEVRPVPMSDNRAGHQENSGSNKPVNSNIKKPSQGQKVSSKQTENKEPQPESERSSKRKAVPSQHDSDSETVK